MSLDYSQMVTTTDIKEYPLTWRGKVRDVYDLGDTLLFVASDRISAFDVVLPGGIPGKGKILAAMSLFWFSFLKDIVPNHLVTANVDEYPKPLHSYRSLLEGRSMIVKKAERVDCECIVRGFISGSMWKELVAARKAGKNEVHGFTFSSALSESGKLQYPMFTPSSKNDTGHDINISFAELEKRIGSEMAGKCKETSLAIYRKAFDYALRRGIIIADTKFEFGMINGQFTLIDEALTPDSSRFWPLLEYQQGRSQPSYDKQPIRDYLETLNWDKTPPGPKLPDEVIEASIQRYRDAQRLLTGKSI